MIITEQQGRRILLWNSFALSDDPYLVQLHSLYTGGADMTFSDAHRISFGPLTPPAVADFNGDSLDFNEDGIPDIAAARSEATNILYFGNVKATSKLSHGRIGNANAYRI